MDNKHIEKKILIHAKPENVWRVFTDPVVTKKMGGTYITDWKEGGTLSWKGEDGKIYTHGIILQIEKPILLKHSLLDLETKSNVSSVITYTLEKNGDYTEMHATEDLTYPMDDEEFDNALEGWDMALDMVKSIAEKL